MQILIKGMERRVKINKTERRAIAKVVALLEAAGTVNEECKVAHGHLAAVADNISEKGELIPRPLTDEVSGETASDASNQPAS